VASIDPGLGVDPNPETPVCRPQVVEAALKVGDDGFRSLLGPAWIDNPPPGLGSGKS
jgi:hypothetical protein